MQICSCALFEIEAYCRIYVLASIGTIWSTVTEQVMLLFPSRNPHSFLDGWGNGAAVGIAL